MVCGVRRHVGVSVVSGCIYTKVGRSPNVSALAVFSTTRLSFNTSFIRAYSIIDRFPPCSSLLLPNFKSISCRTSESRKVCRFYATDSHTLRLKLQHRITEKNWKRVPSLPEPCEFRYSTGVTDDASPFRNAASSFLKMARLDRRKWQCYTKSYVPHSRRSILRTSIFRLMGLQSLQSTVRSHCGPNSNASVEDPAAMGNILSFVIGPCYMSFCGETSGIWFGIVIVMCMCDSTLHFHIVLILDCG
jgi:hypothetical protein